MSLHCENVVKTYGGKDVLHDVTLDLKPGKIYGLIGRNGAGKTTLLSILAAQNPASRGTVTLDGEPVWENRKSLAKICFSRELNANAESGLAAMKAKEYLRIAATYYDSWDKALEERLEALQAEAEKGQRTAAQLEEIRAALEHELTFQNGINSALVTTILDKIVVKKDSTKERIHLDIHLKFGGPWEAAFSRADSSLCFTRPKSTTPKAPTRRT